MILISALIGAFVLPGLLYYEEKHEKKAGGLIMKVVSSTAFVLFGIFMSKHCGRPELAKYIVIGQILGAVGDVFLHVDQFFENTRLPFCIGGIAFLAGHICFISGIIRLEPAAVLLSCILAAVFYAVVLTLLLKLTKIDRVMRILISLYMLTVSSFAAFALAAFLWHPEPARGILAAGALVFLFGDFDLMLHLWSGKKWKFLFPCLYVYYPAQIIIGLSLYFFR